MVHGIGSVREYCLPWSRQTIVDLDVTTDWTRILEHLADEARSPQESQPPQCFGRRTESGLIIAEALVISPQTLQQEIPDSVRGRWALLSFPFRFPTCDEV